LETININLIGESGKTSKAILKDVAKKKAFDAKKSIFSYILLISILVVFSASLGGWLVLRKMTSNLNKNIVSLSQEINSLKEKENEFQELRDNLRLEKQRAEYKLIVQKKLKESFFPWSQVLKEISTKVPKDVIVLKIDKTDAEGGTKLKISGVTSSGVKIYPLTAISLFIFNLNENENSLLSSAKISKLEFNEKTKVYEFTVDTSVRQDKTNGQF
jgi:Tfp pilus assembly protein PilN